jgi:hypothetical protein
MTTNLPFSERTQVIPNARLYKAVLNRITDRAHILVTGNESYRFRRNINKQKKGEKAPDTKGAVEMPARGKHGKPKTGFPPFPPSLEIPQKPRDFHIPTASTVLYICQPRPNGPAENRRQIGWAKLNCRSRPSSIAKRKWVRPSMKSK